MAEPVTVDRPPDPAGQTVTRWRQPLLTLILLGLVLVVGGLITWATVRETERAMRAQLLLDARLLAQSLNLEHLETFSGTAADLDSARYRRVKQQFITIARANPRWHFVYLMGRNPAGELFVMLDSEPDWSADYSPLGDPYPEAEDDDRAVFAQGVEVVTGPATDRWGTFISAQVPIFATARAPVGAAGPEEASALVARASARYDSEGRDALLAAIGQRDGPFHRGDLYAFAYDLDMTFLAHPVRPELVGQNLIDRPDRPGGKLFRREIQHIALHQGAGWVDYEYLNPTTGEIEPKRTYVRRVGDLIICAGAYQGRGPVIAAFGIDMEARDWRLRVWLAALPAGLLTLTLLALILIGTRRLQRGPRPPGGVTLEARLTLVAGLAVTLYALWFAHAREDTARQGTFAQLAADRTDAIARSLRVLRDIELAGLASFRENAPAATGAAIAHYAAYLTRNPTVRGWAIAPAVSAAQLPAFVASLAETGLPAPQVWQLDAADNRVAASGRDWYFPVLDIVPETPGNAAAEGFDLASEPGRRAAIERALATGLTTATEPVPYVGEPGSPPGVRVLRPLASRDGMPSGIAVAGLRLDALLYRGAADQATLLELAFLDRLGLPRPLARNFDPTLAPRGGPRLTRTLPIFGEVLQITARAGPDFLRQYPRRAGYLAALVGLLLSIAATLVVNLLARRDAGLRTLVDARTDELERFFTAGLDMLCIADIDGMFRRLNPEWEAVLGYRSGQLEGTSFLDLVHPDDLAATRAAIARLDAQQPVLKFENRYRRADGVWRWIEWRSMPHGRNIYAAAHDITERKQEEAETARRLALERAAAGLSARFARAQPGDLDALLHATLAALGPLLAVDHAYLIRCSEDGARMSNTHEWCAPGVAGLMARNQDIEVARLPWWQGRMAAREPVAVPEVAGLPPEAALEQAELESQGIAALLCLPINDASDRLRGYLGVDMVHGRRDWAGSDIGILNLLVQVIGSTMGRLEAFDRLQASEAALRRETRLQELLMSISSTYINLPPERVDRVINRSLGDLGGFVGADRAYLFDYHFDRGICTNTHEWCAPGIEPQLGRLQAVPTVAIADWAETHRRGEAVFVADVFELPADSGLRQVLEPQGIKSALAVPLMDAGTCRGFVGFDAVHARHSWSATEQRLLTVFAQMLVNVQKRREVEAALRDSQARAEAASRSKSEFLANMSHEIRTPMNAVIGLSQLLLQTPLNDEQRDHLGKIHGASRLLLGIINDILDYSKIEAGKLELESRDFGLEQVLEQMATLFGAAADDKNLELMFQVAPDVPQAVRGDALRLGQVLTNLLGNAIKFTERGTVTVNISRTGGNDQEARLRFAVQDSGIGMDRAQIDRLFAPFAQADTSTTRRYGGTGLGLVISRKLVERMGGVLGVTSAPAQGSTFWFEITLPGADAPGQTGQPDQLHGNHVLVVDDQPAARALLRAILEGIQCQVEEAGSGAAAVAAVVAAERAERHFDFVLMDWRMPGELDGLGAIRRLRDLRAQGVLSDREAPVVIISAYRHGDLPADHPPFDGFLAKPVTALPLFDAMLRARGAPALTSAPAPAAQPDFAGAEVLLAEDIAVNQIVAARMLERTGVRVTIANNGAEAVQRVTAGQFDLVLMDLQMPVMDGFEATRTIRRTHPRLPIIALTAAVMDADRDQARAAGMDDHLAKPIDPDALYDALARWLPAGARAAATAPPPAPSAPVVPGGLPQLAGFDAGRGLLATDRDTRAWQRLLLVFREQLTKESPHILAGLEHGDSAAIRRFAHSLKGSAGIVGAVRLAAAAAAIDEQLRAGGALTGTLRDELRSALAETQTGLATLDTPGSRATAAVDPAVGAAAVREVLRMLNNSDLIDDELLNTALGYLGQTLGTDDCAGLRVLIERFEQDAAAARLSELASRAGVQL